MKILLLILMLPLMAQAQAPFWRNPWTTNQPPAPVKGDNTMTVSNYQTHIWWDFWGTNAFTVAHLTDVTNIVHDATNAISGGSSTNGLATTNYVNNATNTLYGQVTTDLNAASNTVRTLAVNATNTLYGQVTADLNAASNSVRTLAINATNTLYGQTTTDLNAASNALRTVTVNATNTLYGQTTTDLNAESNALRTFSLSLTNGLSSTTNPTFYGSVNLAANVSDYVTATKNRVFTLTNNSGGGRWLSAIPSMTRRRSGYWEPTGPGGLQVLGDSAATTGTASTANAGTNVWPEATYATAATANTDAGVSGGATTANTYSPGRNCYASFNGRISQTSTQRVWIGLTGAVLATINASDAPTTASLAAIRFSTSAANTNFCFVTCDGSACTTTVGNIIGVTTNRHRWEIIEDNVNNRWIAYMDGLPLATNSANLPISTLQPLFSVRTLEATAKTIRLEAYYGEQDFISGQPFIE